MHIQSYEARPSIYEYDDYRRFLKDLYLHYKATTTQFSYRYFSMRAGFKSPNFLKLVIEGKRNLSPKSAAKFGPALRLNRSESEFLLNLVQFCQAETGEDKVLSAREILKSRTLKKVHPLKQAELKYYARWYYIPIRELVGTGIFREDGHWIASQFRFPLSPEEALQALKDLELLGLIERNANGKLVQTHKILSSGDDVMSALIVQYHKDMITKAAQSIDEISHLEREISATCITCNPDTVQRIKLLLREMRKEILALADGAANPSLVYQINFQLFPLIGQSHHEECTQ